MIYHSSLIIEIAELVADHGGRPIIDADYELAEQIIERVFKHAEELKAKHKS